MDIVINHLIQHVFGLPLLTKLFKPEEIVINGKLENPVSVMPMNNLFFSDYGLQSEIHGSCIFCFLLTYF